MHTENRLTKVKRFSVLALPIFPGRRQPSIVGSDELNYRVRNGNGWTLILINTNYLLRPENRTKGKKGEADRGNLLKGQALG